MEQLFDVILSNPVILVAIIAFLVSMLRGKKAPQGMPSFGGDPDNNKGASQPPKQTVLQENRHEGHQRREGHQNEMPGYSMSAPSTFHSEVYTESYSRDQKLEECDSVWEKSSLTNSSLLSTNEIGSASESANTISAADARQGVIWAEILGPPRAKRPFRK